MARLLDLSDKLILIILSHLQQNYAVTYMLLCNELVAFYLHKAT